MWATEEWPFGRKGVSTKNNNLTLQSQISNHTDKQVGRPESICFLKMGQSRPLFVYFRDFLNTISIIQNEKSVDGVLGIRTRGLRMVGNDATTELWRHPQWIILLFLKNIWSSSQKRHFSSDLVPINVHFHQFSCWQCHFTSDLTSYRKSHLTSDLVPLKRYFLVSSWKC